MVDRYASCFPHLKNTQDFRPTALQVLKDQNLLGKWSDKTILVTGTTSGIGLATAQALQQTGAQVFITARNEEKAKELENSHFKDVKNVHVMPLALDSLASVKSFVSKFLAQSSKLNIMINNAGVMACPYALTEDGIETQFAVNHIAHFALVRLLLPTLLASATPDFASRVIAVTSSGHRMGGVNFDDLNFEKEGSYSEWAGYGQSKTATIYLANELERRFGSKGLHANSVMPGGIWTPLQRHQPGMKERMAGNEDIEAIFKTEDQGAATQVWGACAAELEGVGGKYLEDNQIAKQVKEGATMMDGGYAPHAMDVDAATKIWERSEEILKSKGFDLPAV